MINCRVSYSHLLNDNWDSVDVGAVVGDDRELHAGIYCMMYFDTPLSRGQISAAFKSCKTEGRCFYFFFLQFDPIR